MPRNDVGTMTSCVRDLSPYTGTIFSGLDQPGNQGSPRLHPQLIIGH
jgi:hypothetical protein